MKKSIIKINESQLRQIVMNSISKVLKEGTDKQNAFLRKLMGDRYKDEYDMLGVRETSAMIDAELAKQDNIGVQNTRFATPKQVAFLMNNRYHKLPWISKIQNKLTFKDSSELCDAVSAYKGRRNAGGWSIRTVKEVWIPSCAEVTSKIARKYGLIDDALAELAWSEDFLTKEKNKRDKEMKKKKEEEIKKKKEDLSNAVVVFVSTHDYEHSDMFGKMKNSLDDTLDHIYMHGKLESAMGWDIPTVVKGYEEPLERCVDEAKDKNRFGHPVYTIVRVEGYDEPCWLLLWYGVSRLKGKCVSGIIVDKTDHESIRYARECAKNRICDI